MSQDSTPKKDLQSMAQASADAKNSEQTTPHIQTHQAPARNTAQFLAKKKNQPQAQRTQYVEARPMAEPTIVDEVTTDIMSDITNMVQGPGMDAPKEFLKKGFSKAKSFALRVVVHISSLFCAGVMVSFLPFFSELSIGEWIFTALGVYIGLICLIARDISSKAEWTIPAGLGLVQMLLALALGIPMPQGLFWGGAQAWVQRLFAKRFSMGTEWLPLVLILPLSLLFSMGTENIFPLILSFGALALGGSMFWPLRSKLAAKKLEEKKNPPKKADNKAVTETKPEEKKEGPYDKYKDSIAKLRSKQLLIPADMQNSLKNLIVAAEAIVLCMQKDSRDKEVGEKFLRQYLPSTHSVLDNFCRFSGTAVGDTNANEDMLANLKESGDILLRLEQAFINEHKALLRNDIDDFSADLKVLDTLLKMRGH